MAQLTAQIVSYDDEFKRQVARVLRARGVPVGIVEGRSEGHVELEGSPDMVLEWIDFFGQKENFKSFMQVLQYYPTQAVQLTGPVPEAEAPLLAKTAVSKVRLALPGVGVGVACDGCPSIPDLMKRYEAAGGQYYVCPICFNTKKLSQESLIGGAELQGTVPLWAWIGDETATTRSRPAGS